MTESSENTFREVDGCKSSRIASWAGSRIVRIVRYRLGRAVRARVAVRYESKLLR